MDSHILASWIIGAPHVHVILKIYEVYPSPVLHVYTMIYYIYSYVFRITWGAPMSWMSLGMMVIIVV